MEAKKDDSNEAEIPKDFGAPLPAKEEIKNLLCPDCKSSLEIISIEMEDMKYIITYTCQNNHMKEKVPLHEFVQSQISLEPKEVFSCKNHNGIPTFAYCKKCETELCTNCSFEEIHDDHKEKLLIYSSLMPKKSQMKEFVQGKIKEYGLLEKNKNLILNWLEELKLKIVQYVEDQKQLNLMQQGFVNNINPMQINISKIKTLNYLMGNKAGQVDECISEEKFKGVEEKLIDLLALTTESFPSMNFTELTTIIKNKEDWNTIIGFLDNKPKKLEKIYSAKNDGDSAKKFHQKCDNQGPTLTIIETTKGFIFGGYTSLNWQTEDDVSHEDPTSFLFSLNNKKKYPAGEGDGIKNMKNNAATWYNKSNSYYVLNVEDDCCSNTSSATWNDKYFGHPKLQENTSNDTEHFKVVECEIFKVEI